MAGYEQLLLRRKEIEKGLLELMRTVPYDQISVTALAAHLGLSRKCFYHYFPNKEACLDSLMERTIQECALFISEKTSFEEDVFQAYVRNLCYWKQNRGILDAVMENNLILVLLRHCMEHLHTEEKGMQDRLDRPHVAVDHDVLLFFTTGQLALLLNWCLHDFDTPVEELAEKMIRLIHTPLIEPGEAR